MPVGPLVRIPVMRKGYLPSTKDQDQNKKKPF